MNFSSKKLQLVSLLILIGFSVMGQRVPDLKVALQKMDSFNSIRSHRFAKAETPRPLFDQKIVSRATQRNISKRSVARLTPSSPDMTVCYDTSGRFFLKEDTMNYFANYTIRSRDGNYLVCGEYSVRVPPYNSYGAFLMKCTDSGTISWIKLYDSANNVSNNYMLYYMMRELSDGSIIMAGLTNDLPTWNDDLLLTRTDGAGNIIWSKTYKSRIWTTGNGSADYFGAQQLEQDPFTGDLFLTGPHWSTGRNISKFRLSDGNVLWSKVYDPTYIYFDRPFGFDIRANDLVAFTNLVSQSGYNLIAIFNINKTTGDTIATRYYQTINPPGLNLGFVRPEELIRLDNGNYAISGSMVRYYYYSPSDTLNPLYHAGVIEFDQNLNFVKAYAIGNRTPSNSYNTRISVFKDGTGLFTMLNYISGFTADVFYVQFRDGQLIRQRKRHYLGEGIPNEPRAVKLDDGGDMIVKLLGDTINNYPKVEFLKLHISDTASDCLGQDENSHTVLPFSVAPISWSLISIGSNDFSESRNKTLTPRNGVLNYFPGCPQISHCDTLSILTPADTICLSSPLYITFRKNPECGATPFWDFDRNIVDSFVRINDTVFRFAIKSSGVLSLRGSIFGCTLITDSLKVVIVPSKVKPELGKDTIICPGNTIRINAGSGYASYLWQDGSTDSILAVNQPGTYHVRTTDSCGNVFRDTITIAPHPPIPFDLGADKMICEGDTVTITAPSGFFNYKWAPDYKISSVTGQTVKLFPARDTIYSISAEKTAGCFVYDSIRIKVNNPPSINLGPDQSFCSGDSVVLDAGSSFVNYLWNNGSINRQITVKQVGTYSVSAKDVNGCNSRDTFRVINVFSNPVINLGSDPVICIGSSRLLDAGNGSQYLWNTGSNQRILTVTQTGTYYVTVTDLNGCIGTDTISINKSVNPPAGFLPADTLICNYGYTELRPNGTYTSYLWNSNQTSASISISKAGLYWLQVKDQYNCTGRDSILVTLKECLKGFFVPNAFTPNNDRNNNTFKPLIYGNLVKYEFMIYNRWGQLVFRTSDINKSWDGKVGGQPQSTGTYVWTCTYQLENEKLQFEKGTVILVR